MNSIQKLTVADMKRLNEAAGQQWFKPDTMRFHGTVIKGQPSIDGYFITNDSRWNGDKGFTVRQINVSTGKVSTIGDLAVFNTIAEAREYRNACKRRTTAQ